MAPSEMLSVPKAAAYLGVSTATVYLLTAAGKITFHRIGQGKGALRYTPDDLDAYVASTRTLAAGASTDAKPARATLQPTGKPRNFTPRAARPGKAKRRASP